MNAWIRSDRSFVGGALVFVAAAGFGTLPIFGTIAADVGLTVPTLLIFRFLVATVAIWAYLAIRNRIWFIFGRSLALTAAAGALYGLANILYFTGLTYVSASVAALVFYTYPVIVFVVAASTLGEQHTPIQFLALVVAIGGVGLIVGVDPAGADPVGVLLLVLAAGAYGMYVIGSRFGLETIATEPFTANTVFMTMLALVPLGMTVGTVSIPVTIEQWAVIGGIGILGTAIPLLLFIRGVSRIEASKASVIAVSEPLIAVILGILLFGDPTPPALLAGGLLVLTGAILVQIDP